MKNFREIGGIFFDIKDDDFDIIELSMALVALGFAINFPGNWKEILRNWPGNKPLPWGPQTIGDDVKIHNNIDVELWRSIANVSMHEAADIINQYITHKSDNSKLIAVINPKYKLKSKKYPDIDDDSIAICSCVSITASVKFIAEDPETGQIRGLYAIYNVSKGRDIKSTSHHMPHDYNFFIQISEQISRIRTPRYLRFQATSVQPDHSIRIVEYFRPDLEHLVSIWIAPLAPGETADGPAFPEDKLQPGPQGSELTVVLVEPNQLAEPLVGRLLLPKEGRSDACVFTVPPLKVGTFEGTIIVLHRNRVIQTATLSGSVVREGSPPGQSIAFKIDAVVRHDLANLEFRNPFDVAIVIGGNNARTTAIGGQVYVREMDDVTGPAGIIRETLDEATRQEEPSLDDMLYTCAHQGIMLRQAVLDGAPAVMTGAQSIQLVSAKPEAFLPLEFCYDGKAPDKDAKVCRDVGGNCRATCTKAGTAAAICPLAFWGLSRVIERHTFDTRQKVESGWELRRETSGQTQDFGNLCVAILGASTRTDDHDGTTKLADVVAALDTAGVTPIQVHDWSQWRGQVGGLTDNRAALLLVIGHTEHDAKARVGVLEIGNDKLLLSEVDRDLIGNGNALAIILGCHTIGDGKDVNRFVTSFRRSGAAVVIGTTTAVLGRHATPFAKALVEGLAQRTTGSQTVSLGTLMRDLRLHFLSQDIPVGLAAVAFGDADWVFGTTKTER